MLKTVEGQGSNLLVSIIKKFQEFYFTVRPEVRLFPFLYNHLMIETPSIFFTVLIWFTFLSNTVPFPLFLSFNHEDNFVLFPP